ncbi:MAG TPA: hypothetical protein VHE30_04770 [Polyangiaceae bacterium]|nr:hypothetical protein [Polyangiaceae bacterium]
MKANLALGISVCGGALAALTLFGCSDDTKTSTTPVTQRDGGTEDGGGSGGKGGGSGGSGGKGGSGGGSGGASTDGGDGGTPFSIASTYCVTKSLDQVACGEYIVRHVSACGDCHSPLGPTGPQTDADHYLTGNPTFADLDPTDDTKGMVGTPNLTVLKGQGWTATDLKNAFLKGERSTARGGGLFPIMPYYVFHNMADDDADAIAAFILSLPSKGTQVPERQPLPAKYASVPLPTPVIDETTVPKASAGADQASADHGRYLASAVAPCMECHTPRTPFGALDPAKYFAGGEPFEVGPPFGTVTALNITPAKSGIQGWTAADVQKLILQGVDEAGMPICPPMPAGPFGAFGGMDPGEALDIGNYLTNIAGVENPEDGGRFMMCVPPMPPSDGGMMDSGTSMPMDSGTD